MGQYERLDAVLTPNLLTPPKHSSQRKWGNPDELPGQLRPSATLFFSKHTQHVGMFDFESYFLTIFSSGFQVESENNFVGR